MLSNHWAQLLYVTFQDFLALLAHISLKKGGLLNYVIMKVVIRTHRDILLDVQGTNIVCVYLAHVIFLSLVYLQWSGQQVQVVLSEILLLIYYIQ